MTERTRKSEAPADEAARHFMRHVLATIAYRGGKTLRDAPEGFGDLRIREGVRTPLELVAHLGDLLGWTISSLEGARLYSVTEPESWDAELERFYSLLGQLDDYLASGGAMDAAADRIFQGPLADCLTHVGQLAMLRRLADAPLAGESFAAADIAVGQVGPDQPPPRRPFS